MSEAEVHARAETIADIFLEAKGATELDTESKAEFVASIQDTMKNVMNGFTNIVLPVLFIYILVKTIMPGFGIFPFGYHGPWGPPRPAPAAKPAGAAQIASMSQIDSMPMELDDLPEELAQMDSHTKQELADFFAQVDYD